MRFAVLYSRKDTAGMNIAKQLKSFFLPQIPRIKLFKDSINAERVDKMPELRNSDFLVFATKHKSRETRKTLSLHAPGNWRNADFGGKESKVCPTSALILKFLFQQLNKNATQAGSDYQVTLECTHHGPYLEKPCCFIEIGSGEEQWQDEKAGKIIAKTISDLQNYQKKYNGHKVAIGLGGPHYCPNFNKIQLGSDYAMGHVIPEYSLPLTEPIIKQAIEKTEENVDTILLDWKGLGKSEERQKTLDLLKHLGLGFKRTSEVEK